MLYWYQKCWRQYADFSGRARRKEYWYFVLVQFLIFCILFIPFLITANMDQGNEDVLFAVAGIIYGLYFLASFIPSLAVMVRRLHDTGKSGWYYLFSLVPFGNLILLIFMLEDSHPGANKWGDNPKSFPDELNEIGDDIVNLNR